MKSTIKKVLHKIGFEISRFDPEHSDAAQLKKMLDFHNINTIFDIGANEGQFGYFLREVGYKHRIISFEPLQTAWKQLLKNSQNDAQWSIAPRSAIGNINNEIEINISNNSQSSSILKMLKTHSDAAPESSYIGVEKAPIRTLDSVVTEYLDSHSIPFLKIDTQGYEDRVLEGARETLNKTVGLQLELSLIPLYKDQKLYDDLVRELRIIGFNLWGIKPVFIDQSNGRLLQVDATFFRD